MLENLDEVLKIQELLKKKFPQKNSEEIEKISLEFMELGFFWVGLQIKQHSKATETHGAEDLGAITENPP